MRRGKRLITVKNVLIGLILFLLVVVAMVLFLWEKPKDRDVVDDPVSQENLGKIKYDGKFYQYNEDLTNILYMGIDNDDKILAQDIPGMAGQSDVLMILSLNEKTKEARILQIPRDTITEVDLYDDKGEMYDRKSMQIALQYTYTTGGENGCWAVKKTVSELLYDLYIDSYVAMDIAAIPILNDAVGGVAISMKNDYTYIDSAFVKGVDLTLNGQQAKKFIQYRDIEEAFSNRDRMDRQLQYIPALIDTVRSTMSGKTDDYSIFYDKISEYIVTDMNEDQMNSLAEYNLVEAQMERVPGTWQEGESHDEFHVDEQELQKKLIEMFYVLD